VIAAFTGPDFPLADHAAALLDVVGRRTPLCAVALHSLAAAEHLGRRPAPKVATAPGDDRTLLREALRRLAELSDTARRQDEVAEALHQTMLAYLASR
jgi:hypothetical protein